MNCKEGVRQIAGQIVELLDGIERPDYARPLNVFNGSTLGQHFRHILEFYRCLLDGVEEGLIDYAGRRRDPRIEQDPRHAQIAFQDIMQAISRLDEEKTVLTKADFSSAEGDARPLVRSSVGRELMFAYDHAVHHLALIEIGLRLGVSKAKVDPNLGVAPSTVKYRAGKN